MHLLLLPFLPVVWDLLYRLWYWDHWLCKDTTEGETKPSKKEIDDAVENDPQYGGPPTFRFVLKGSAPTRSLVHSQGSFSCLSTFEPHLNVDGQH